MNERTNHGNRVQKRLILVNMFDLIAKKGLITSDNPENDRDDKINKNSLVRYRIRSISNNCAKQHLPDQVYNSKRMIKVSF